MKTLIRIICGGLISLLLMFVLFPLTSGAVVPIIVVLSIYVNRQRLRFIRQYFHYIWKPILYVIIALVVSVILSVGVVVSIKDTNVAGTCIIAILTCSFLWASCAFLKGEQEKGIPFLYCQKLLFVVPIMSILFLFSFAMAYHVFDPMVDTSDLLTEDMLSAHTTDYGNQQIDEINVEDSFRVASSDAANVQALHQMAEPVPHDFSVTSTSFNFTPVDGMSHVNTPNGFDIQDSDGHTLLTVNNVAGTVQDGHGNYIAHIQDDKLVDMHTGDMIVWHDKVSGIYRSGLSQIININNYGEGVFQSIKDIHGNGIEVINDEVFDAKTHERIGNIRQV